MLEFASVRFRLVGTDPTDDLPGRLAILPHGIEWVPIRMLWQEAIMREFRCRDSGVLLSPNIL